MCAGTVVEPPVPVSAASVSVTSRSRSVAFSDSFAFSARISTLPRIGMVLRRSTTRCTWPSDFSSCARSTVTFIAKPARSQDGKAGRPKRHAAAFETRKPDQTRILIGPAGGPQGGADGRQAQEMRDAVPHVLGEFRAPDAAQRHKHVYARFRRAMALRGAVRCRAGVVPSAVFVTVPALR